MSNVVYLTREGLDKLKSELHHLKTTERNRIIKAIADARDKGDLSENAEYDAAKDAQGMLEAKIAQMEAAVGNARLIDESQIDTSKAYILSTVHVQNLKTKKAFKYTLVSAQEADFKVGKISVKSPIGQGLLGKAVGEVAEIKAPAGLIRLKITKIERDV